MSASTSEPLLGAFIADGKTKIFFHHPTKAGVGRFHDKDRITWNDERNEPAPGKGALCTTMTKNFSGILAARGRRTAFLEEVAPSWFDATLHHMVLIEAVVRFENHPRGSYHKRHPDVPLGPLMQPVTELFLKSKDRSFQGIDLSDVGDDPLITRVEENGFWVHHAKRPVTGPGKFIPYVQEGYDGDLRQLALMLHDAVLTDGTILHDLFLEFGWRLADMKEEFGVELDSRKVPRGYHLVSADSLDADSIRVTDQDGVEHSKQVVRDTDSVEDALPHYELVAEISGRMLESVLRA